MKIPQDMHIGCVHETKHGRLEITEYISARKVGVKFTETGFSTYAQAGDIRRSSVKDSLKPLIFGVGFFGSGPYKARENGKLTVRYNTWADMLQRCYDPKWHEKKPTYKGCSVVPAWHNYQLFSEWFDKNYIEGFHLDKDIKVDGNKVYGPDTCLFVSLQDNSEKAFAKHFKLKNPEGKVVEIYNLRKFCLDNNLHDSGLCNVHSGKWKSYKGWTKA
jgi:hypothetical protein